MEKFYHTNEIVNEIKKAVHEAIENSQNKLLLAIEECVQQTVKATAKDTFEEVTSSFFKNVPSQHFYDITPDLSSIIEYIKEDEFVQSLSEDLSEAEPTSSSNSSNQSIPQNFDDDLVIIAHLKNGCDMDTSSTTTGNTNLVKLFLS